MVFALILNYSNPVYAIKKGNKSTISKSEKTTKTPDLNKQFYEAIAGNNLKLVKELVSKGVKVNQVINIS